MPEEIVKSIFDFFGLPIYLFGLAWMFGSMSWYAYSGAAAMCERHRSNIASGGAGLHKERQALRKFTAWRDRYASELERVKSAIDARLGAETFTLASYGPIFRLSSIVPFVLLFSSWVVTGRNVTFVPGALSDNAGGFTRSLMLLQISVGLASVAYATRPSAIYRRFWGVSGTILLLVFAINCGLHGAVALLGGALGAVAAALSVEMALFAVVLAYVYGLLGSVYTLGVSGVVPLASGGLYLVFNHIRASYKNEGFFFAMVTVALLVGVLYLAWQTATFVKFEWQKAIVIFGLVIPLITAAFDWISLGMSRHLLARLAQAAPHGVGKVATLIAWGVLAATVLMVGLAASLTLFAALLNTLSKAGGGGAWVDLALLFKTARETPGDSSLYWLYVLMATTLGPLALNIAAATTGLAAWSAPDATRELYERMLNKPLDGDFFRQRTIACFITRIQITGWFLASLAVVVLGFLLFLGVPWLGRVILWACEAAARLVGAV